MQYKTLFFSDIHLGSSFAQAEAFLSFFKENQFEKIYIVGDFIDFWALMRKGKNWRQSHNDVLQKLLRAHRKGVKSTWIVGNHDEFMAQFDGENFGGIEIKLNDIHIAADGKKYLIMHGHELDLVMKYAKWLMKLGARAYDTLIWLNYYIHPVAKICGMKNFSLSQYLKHKVKSAANFIGAFEHGIVAYAKHASTDGVICGHIHSVADVMIDGVRYLNCGDWVESMTALVETMDGQIQIIKHKDLDVSNTLVNNNIKL